MSRPVAGGQAPNDPGRPAGPNCCVGNCRLAGFRREVIGRRKLRPVKPVCPSMIFRGALNSVLSRALAVSMGLGTVAFSQSLEELVEKSATAMEQNRWEQALDLNNRAISQFGRKNPFRTYGAQFGAIYYRKGICE